MGNPWETIRLYDYEAHMRAEGVAQLQALSRITREQLEYGKASVAVLGAAGGNGLEHVNPDAVSCVWALDINEEYLAACRERFPQLDGRLKTICCDLAAPDMALPACALLICNLVIEYIGMAGFISLIEMNRERLDVVSCVIQSSRGGAFVSESPTAGKLIALEGVHHDIGEAELTAAMEGIGFRIVLRKAYPLPNAKELIRLDFTQQCGE